MADLTVQQQTVAGSTPTFAAAAVGGDAIPGNDGRVVLRVLNGGVGAITVTIVGQSKCDQGFTHSAVVNVPNGAAVVEIGPFNGARFNDGNGKVQITYSGVTSVTVAAVRAA
jgi:hypothetical protein